MIILLERKEVNPDKSDHFSWTPLSYPASTGHEGVAKILLAPDEVDVDKPNIHGRTPLSFATKNGHEWVVALLRSRNTVIPSTI